MEIVYAFGTGAILGAIFGVFKLPVPAPGSVAGVVGIVGIFCGYVLMKSLM